MGGHCCHHGNNGDLKAEDDDLELKTGVCKEAVCEM